MRCLVLVAVLHDVHHLREQAPRVVLGEVSLLLQSGKQLTTLAKTN